jgi:hypothetical protein
MANTTGSGTAVRVVAGVGTTSGSKALTGSAGSFSQRDVGAAITGTNIPAGNTVASVASDTAATMGGSNATGTGSVSATIGPRLTGAAGFLGWKPETDARAADYSFASAAAGTVPLDRLSDNITRTSQYVEH